ncbi:MAG: Fic family protein [Halioglobus sp.]|nr:Fic family protein [Halioglobus sp.]
MKLPESPPTLEAAFAADPEKAARLYRRLLADPVQAWDARGRYLHWEKLRHLQPPPELTSEEHWLATKLARRNIAKRLPLLDKQGEPLRYCLPDAALEYILWISEQAAGTVGGDPRITDPKTQRTYLINSLIEEAISSSQLEGAATSRRVAKEMIRTGRKPRDKSEQMVLNNYHAMRFILDHVDDALTPSMVFELHRILVQGTLEAGYESRAGVVRAPEDDIVVSWEEAVLHVPPPVAELDDRLARLCHFVNGDLDTGHQFFPPVVRAVVAHFMIGYDHPFFDGNGRVARALFYWVMAQSGFWLMEYTSISRVIKASQISYLKAYLYTESDDNDLTYFILHQLAVVRQAIEDLHNYLARKARELRDTERALQRSGLKGKLNYRQLALLKNALDNPGAQYTFASHRTSHGISYQSARTDLLELSDEFGVLRKLKEGKKMVFVAPNNLPDLIRRYRRAGRGS